LVGKTALLTVCGLLAAAAALAQGCSYSILVSVINVVGRNASGADPYGTFTVTIRDCTNQPIANADVRFDFSNCTDGTLCLDAVTDGGTYDCSGTNKEVHGTTNLAGQVTITIQGGRKAPAPPCLGAGCSPPGPGAGCVQIFANGVPMANASAVYVNQMFLDGSEVNGGDTSVEQREVICAGLGAPYRARHDLQFNGAINGGDTSVLQAQVVRAGLGVGTTIGCASICPN
jgi:hypothetical protein